MCELRERRKRDALLEEQRKVAQSREAFAGLRRVLLDVVPQPAHAFLETRLPRIPSAQLEREACTQRGRVEGGVVVRNEGREFVEEGDVGRAEGGAGLDVLDLAA